MNEAVVAQHAEEAAFLWTVRERAAGEAHYSLRDLATLDARVAAHIDGLMLSGEIARGICEANLDVAGPGEVFALAVTAYEVGDRERMRVALQSASVSRVLRSGLVSALGWLDYSSVSKWVRMLLDAKAPEHRTVGIAGSAVHREDPGLALDQALIDTNTELRARALKAVGELKRRDLLNRVRASLRDGDRECRFWAAWALAIHREPDGVASLTRWFEDDILGVRAMHLALRAMSIQEGREWITALAKRPGQERAAVMAAGIVGDPAVVPWLIDRMGSPDLARLAGEAFTSITGVDLTANHLDQDMPPDVNSDEDAPIEQVLELDHDSNLPWPEPSRINSWWVANHRRFTQGVRYLVGVPIAAAHLREILVNGKQRQRAAAALELSLINLDDSCFSVRERGDRQLRKLRSWTS